MSGRRRTGLLAGLLVAALGLAPLAARAGTPALPSAESIVAQFKAVAFGHEHGTPLRGLQRYEEPIRVAFFTDQSTDTPASIGAIGRHLPFLATLTGLRFQPAARFEEATLRIGFMPRVGFRSLISGAPSPQVEDFLATSACIAIAETSRTAPGHIDRGTIVIGSDISPTLRQHCMLEELVQVLGLPNDACNYRPSLFCEDDNVMEMTPADRILLQTLYNPKLTTGMAVAETMPLVQALVILAVQAEASLPDTVISHVP